MDESDWTSGPPAGLWYRINYKIDCIAAEGKNNRVAEEPKADIHQVEGKLDRVDTRTFDRMNGGCIE